MPRSFVNYFEAQILSQNDFETDAEHLGFVQKFRKIFFRPESGLQTLNSSTTRGGLYENASISRILI